MSLDRALQWTTAAVAVIGALFLALGHESGWMPALLAIAAAFSVLVTDLIPRLRLNRIVGNLIAVAAVAWSLYDFLDRTSEQQLMAISQMLVILQVLLLFQEKTGRTYWQLLVLSLLQVVVAAALNSGLEFGVLLAVYMVLSLLALVLLCLHRDVGRDRGPESVEPSATAAGWKQLLSRPRVATPVQPDVKMPLAGRLLSRQLLALTAATTVLTAVFFYITPRLTDSNWRTQRKGESSVTGFAQHIELEEYGRIHQSNQVCLRVILTDAADRTPYTMIGEPYFQGGVLTHYQRDENKSRWVYFPPRTMERYNDYVGYFRGAPGRTLVRQDCMLEAGSSPVAFAVFPFRWPSSQPNGFRLERIGGRIVRSSAEIRTSLGEVRYTGYTNALQHGRQLRAVPHVNPVQEFRQVADLKEELDELRWFDADRFAGLKNVAEQVLRDANAQSANPLEQAQALERHFLYSNRYRYALHLDFPRDRKLDPIEDFVVNHHTGHCEYFASTLALMLRSQGMPARIVTGYKGGEFNMLGQYFVVREKHAHAWVEVWMPPGIVPDAEIAGTPHKGGCWYRLDPTPTSNQYLAGMSDTSLQDQITDTFDYLELMWRDYVVNLNALRQHQAVIDPATANTLDSLPDWIDARSMDRWFQRMGRRLGLPMPRRYVTRHNRIVDWRAVAIMAGALAALITLAQLSSFLFRRLSSWIAGRQGPHKRFHRPPAFYVHLERLLARVHLRRDSGQTAAEFAESARATLTDRAEELPVAELPHEVVQTYYRVRFGGDTLDDTEARAVEQALAQLAPAVGQVPRAHSAPKR
jgi:transglutaminase-like putative cysteine protease